LIAIHFRPIATRRRASGAAKDFCCRIIEMTIADSNIRIHALGLRRRAACGAGAGPLEIGSIASDASAPPADAWATA
jgi:hypothetical protein